MSDLIIAKSKDEWGSENYTLPSGLYFYFLNENLPSWDTAKSGSIIGNCSAIQSVQFTPFIEPTDLRLFHVPYDTERFGGVDKTRPSLTDTPLVFRITAIENNIKKIGSFKCYNPDKTIGGEISWRNESRLYNYPYMFAMITDNLNQPFEIKYHLCNSNLNNVMVRNTISDRCSYGLFVQNYKNDVDGKLEALVSSDAHELPCSSSAYSQWFAMNKNQTAETIKQARQNSFLTKSQNTANLGTNLIGSLSSVSLNPISMIGSGANMLSSLNQAKFSNQRSDLDVQQVIASKIAQTQDMLSTPNTMISMGSDVYYGLDKGGKSVHLFRFGLHNEQYKKLGDYFAMFGYKQNKILTPNIRNRYYFNYIKTVGCNIEGNDIPRNHLEELKGIFDSGVTVWHIDRNGVKVGDISRDNYEV